MSTDLWVYLDGGPRGRACRHGYGRVGADLPRGSGDPHGYGPGQGARDPRVHDPSHFQTSHLLHRERTNWTSTIYDGPVNIQLCVCL